MKLLFFDNLSRIKGPIYGGLSCSVLYTIFSSLYLKAYPSFKLRYFLQYKSIVNPGLLFGIVLGSVYTYLGYPMLPEIYKKIKY